MSARIMNILSEHAPSIEIYSIDEAFIDLTAIPPEERFAFAQKLRDRVTQWTGIPVSFAAQRNLAKVAMVWQRRLPADSASFDTFGFTPICFAFIGDPNSQNTQDERGRASGATFSGVCYLDTQAAIDAALKYLPVGDVWGIGAVMPASLTATTFTPLQNYLPCPTNGCARR